MLLPQHVQDVRGIEPGVITELPWDHLKSLGHGADNQLLLSLDGSGVVTEEFGEFHLDGSTPYKQDKQLVEVDNKNSLIEKYK